MSARNLGKKPVSRDFNWLDLCMKAWGSEFHAPDHGAYEWSNGRKYDSTDKGLTGVYGVEVTLRLEASSPATARYPDMDHSLQASNAPDVVIHTDISSDAD